MERIRSIDLARGFTALFIPAIHTGMLYSHPSVHNSALGYFLIAVAEGPGGQLLMLLMGWSFTLKARHATRWVVIKAIALIGIGYLLNLLKFIIPYCLNALPEAVLVELHVTGNNAVGQLLGIGDILHFAGLSLLVLHVLYRMKQFHIAALLLSVIIIVISPWVWDTRSEVGMFDYLLQLVTGQPPQVFFPPFPWLVYPLTGLLIGYYFKKNPQRTLQWCGILGVGCTAVGLLWDGNRPVHNAAGFYRTAAASTVWHSGIVLVTVYIWHWLSEHCRDNHFFRLLTYSSRHITMIYIIQWVMICWMLPVFGYHTLPLGISAIVMGCMTINAYLVALTFQTVNRAL